MHLLDSLPGVNQRSAQIVIAAIGVEMGRFPSAAQRASWVGLRPGTHHSAGKQLRGTTSKGNRRLRQALIEAAQGAMRTMGAYLRGQGEPLIRRRGKKRAALAVAHTILILAFHSLSRRQPYQHLGSDCCAERERAAGARRSVRRLEQLGVQVTLHAAEEVA
jgi:transposase